MYQTNLTQPCYIYNEYDDVNQKYKNVCRLVQELTEIIKHLEMRIIMMEKCQEPEKVRYPKRCRYFNAGYCKKGSDCLYSHPKEECREYIESGKCVSYRSCSKRHPRECRYWKKNCCFRGDDCEFLHQVVVVNENLANTDADEKETPVEETGQESIVSKKEESRTGMMTAEECLNPYEKEQSDAVDEIVNHEVEDESIQKWTIEEIMNFYENDLNYDSDGNFANIGDKSMNCRGKSQLRIDSTDVGLQRSTRKSRK